MKKIDRNMALAVIIVSTVLMQIHSVQFWMDKTGWVGPFWSIALEGCMLWLWYRNRLLLIRYTAAAFLIAGAWYVMAGPTVNELSGNIETRQGIERAEAKVARLTDSLKTYEENSTKRTQWAKRIDRTTAKIEKAEMDLEEKHKAARGIDFDWRLYMAAAVQVVVLFIVMTTQLKAVSTFRPLSEKKLKDLKAVSEKSKDPKSVLAKRPVLSEKDRAVSAVAKRLKAKLPEYGNVASVMSRALGFSEKNVSFIFTHTRRKSAGKETISTNALQSMMVTLGVEKDEH